MMSSDICGQEDVSPISLDKSKMSKYDLVNSLWDMLEEDWWTEKFDDFN